MLEGVHPVEFVNSHQSRLGRQGNDSVCGADVTSTLEIRSCPAIFQKAIHVSNGAQSLALVPDALQLAQEWDSPLQHFNGGETL